MNITDNVECEDCGDLVDPRKAYLEIGLIYRCARCTRGLPQIDTARLIADTEKKTGKGDG
jgi:hypothetical protein